MKLIVKDEGERLDKYIASNTVKKKYDRSISFIDDVGNVIKNIEEIKQNVNTNKNSGDELSNTLRHICELSNKEHILTKNLWLENIPAVIKVDEIISKYKGKRGSCYEFGNT